MGKPAIAYTAEDGLRVMKYLDLELNPQEQKLFREHFPRLYSTSNRYDLFGTLWEIYAQILPFTAYPTDTLETERKAMLMHMNRGLDITAACDFKLRPQLEQGIPLNEIVGE